MPCLGSQQKSVERIGPARQPQGTPAIPRPSHSHAVRTGEVPEGQGAGWRRRRYERAGDGPGQGGQRYPGQHGSDLGLSAAPVVGQRSDQPPGKAAPERHKAPGPAAESASATARQSPAPPPVPRRWEPVNLDRPTVCGTTPAWLPGQRQHGADHRPSRVRGRRICDDQLSLGLGVSQVDADRPEQCPQGIGQQADRPQRRDSRPPAAAGRSAADAAVASSAPVHWLMST